VPKQLLELKNFLGGISGSPSDTDIPANNAAYSENIDGITVEGRLQGVEGEMILDNGGFLTSSSNNLASYMFNIKRFGPPSTNLSGRYAHILAHVIDWNGSSDPGVTSSFDINTLINGSAFLIEHQEEGFITPENVSSFTGSNLEFVDSQGYVQKATITHIIAASTTGQYIIEVNIDSLRLISGSQITSASGTGGNRLWFGGDKNFIHPGEYFQWSIATQDYYFWFEDSTPAAGYKGDDPNTNNSLSTLTGYDTSPIGFKVSVDLRVGADGISGGSGISKVNFVNAIDTAIGTTYDDEFTFSIHSSGDVQSDENVILTSKKDGQFLYRDITNKITVNTIINSGNGTTLNISTMKSFKDFQDGSKTNIIYHNRINNTINIIEDIYNEVPSFVSPISAALDLNPDFTISRRNIFFGTGNTASAIPKVYSRITHTRLNNLSKENLLTDSRNLPLSYEDSSLNSFDDIMLFPIYGLGEQQMTDKDEDNTWDNTSDVFPDYDILFTGNGSVTLYTEFDDEDLASLSPGQVFRMASTQDTSGADLLDWKRFNYDDNDAIAGDDLFMFVGLSANDTPIVQFVGSAGGSANEPVPAFSFGIKKGSSVISRISLTTQADDDSLDGTASFNISYGAHEEGTTTSFTQLGKRITHIDLKDLGLAHDESITSIAPCLSAPVNNSIGLKGSPSTTHTTGTTVSDLFFDNGHRNIFYRHNVFWVGTIDSAGKSKLYRANLIDFDKLTHNNDPMIEEIHLNYSKIPSTLEAKCGDDDDYAIDSDTAPASGGIIPRLPGSVGANKPSDWDSQWIRKPEDIGAQLIGIVETNESGLISNINTSVTAYTDDTGAAVDNIVEFTARRYRSESYVNPDSDKTQIRLTTGDKVRFAGLDDGTDSRKTFNKAKPYTVRMTDNNKFVIDDGGFTPSLPSSNNTYWWNTKTWLLFKMPSEATRDGFEQWDLFLYNFNPLDIDSSKTAFVADRTVPYSQAGWMNFNDEKTYYPRAFMAWRKQENTGLVSSEGDSGYDDDSYAKLFDHGGSSSWTLAGSSDFERNNARDIQVLNKAGKSRLNGNGSYKTGNKGGTLPLGENIGWVAEEGSWRSINPVAYTLHSSNVLASLYMGAHNRALWSYTSTPVSEGVGATVGANFEKGVDIGHKVHFIGKTSGQFVVKPRLCAKLISGNNSGPSIDMTNDFMHSPYAGWNVIEDIVNEVKTQIYWNYGVSGGPSPHLVQIGRDTIQWVLARNTVSWSNDSIDPGGPHNTVKENHIIPYNDDFVYYSVDEWSGHPGIINKQLNSAHEDYGIVRARPNFGGPEIETPNTTYDDDSSSTAHANPKGGWDGYTPPSWDDVGNGYYVFINRTFASPSYSEVYNPQFQSWMTADKKCKFRGYNWGCTAVRDRNGGGKLDPDGAADKWNNASSTNQYTYTVNGQSITHNPHSNQAAHLRPANANSRNRFDYIMPDGAHYDLYDDGFKTLGDVVTMRKIGFEPGYTMSNIRGAKLFYQRASSTSHRQFLLIYGNQMQDFEGDGIPIMLVGYGGAYANILMDDIDICGNYGDANATYTIVDSQGNANGGYRKALFGYDVPIWSGHPGSFSSAEGHTGASGGWDEDAASFANRFHFTWHNRSTSMMEVTGLSFETSNPHTAGGVGQALNNPMCDWQTDRMKQSTIIGPDLNAFITEEYDSTADEDKKIGFGVSDINGSKYYIGGFKDSSELFFNGANYWITDDATDGTDEGTDNLIASAMFLDVAEYTKLLVPTDGTTVTEDIAFTSGTTVSYRMSLVYDGANESPLSSWKVNHTTSSAVDSITLTLTVGNHMINILNPRVSGVSLWRKHGLNANYTLVKSVEFDDAFWSRYQEGDNELAYKYEIIDRGDVNSSFEILSGLMEDATNQYVHYKISTILGGRLYAGNCWHPEMDDAETHLFRSEEAMYNTFNWADNNLNIKEVPIAMTTFAGRLFVWTKTRMHTIDPTSFTIIDTSEGISIFGQNSYVITEYGMFFADKNNIYVHDGSKVQPIAGPILHNTSRLGEKLGYQGLAKQSLTNGITPTVFYHGPTTSLCVTLSDSSSSGKIYKFNLVNKRWDLINCPNPKSVTEGDDGDILIANEYLLYNFMADESTEYTKDVRKLWRWDSKKFTMGMDTQDKVFRGINIIGTPILETMTGTSSDNLRVYVDGTQKTLSIQNRQYGIVDIGLTGTSIFLTGTITNVFGDPFFVIAPGNEFVKEGMYLKSSESTEIVKVTEIEKNYTDMDGVSLTRIKVNRAQLGTSEDWSSPNNSTISAISPRWKLPAGSKGKQLQIILDNQSGYVDSIGITYKPKGIK